jgi:hypothetical protein
MPIRAGLTRLGRHQRCYGLTRRSFVAGVVGLVGDNLASDTLALTTMAFDTDTVAFEPVFSNHGGHLACISSQTHGIDSRSR